MGRIHGRFFAQPHIVPPASNTDCESVVTAVQVSGDFWRLPLSSWNKLYSRFRSGQKSCDSPGINPFTSNHSMDVFATSATSEFKGEASHHRARHALDIMGSWRVLPANFQLVPDDI